jgi:hypothetical protein
VSRLWRPSHPQQAGGPAAEAPGITGHGDGTRPSGPDVAGAFAHLASVAQAGDPWGHELALELRPIRPPGRPALDAKQERCGPENRRPVAGEAQPASKG